MMGLREEPTFVPGYGHMLGVRPEFSKWAIMHDGLLGLVGDEIRKRSGAVFYSGRASFLNRSDLYLLGLNPGGHPGAPGETTVGEHIEEALIRKEDRWSAYLDQTWGGAAAGSRPLQRRIQHLLSNLGRHPHDVPSSNVVFVRSPRGAGLKEEMASLMAECWPVHEAVIDGLGIQTVLCLGGVAGSWVRKKLGASEHVGTFIEANERRWTSSAHVNGAGKRVITLTHPGVADWRARAADPSGFVTDLIGKSVRN